MKKIILIGLILSVFLSGCAVADRYLEQERVVETENYEDEFDGFYEGKLDDIYEDRQEGFENGSENNSENNLQNSNGNLS